MCRQFRQHFPTTCQEDHDDEIQSEPKRTTKSVKHTPLVMLISPYKNTAEVTGMMTQLKLSSQSGESVMPRVPRRNPFNMATFRISYGDWKHTRF